MALPTTGLTLHCRADRTNQLFTTYSSSGTHTGTPNDGDAVQVWDDEGDGIADVCLAYEDVGTEPNYRSGTPLMKHSCLDFDGSSDRLGSYNQTALAARPLSDFFADNAKTVAIAFWAEAITSTSSTIGDSHRLLTDLGTGGAGDDFGLTLYDSSGTKKIQAFNFPSAYNIAELTVTTGHTWIAIVTHDGVNLSIVLIDEAGAETSASVASGNTNNVAMTTCRIQLGMGIPGTAGFYNGRIGELALYNAVVTGIDLADLKQYFKDQWLTLATTKFLLVRP